MGSTILFLSAGLGVLGEIFSLAHSYFDIQMKSTFAVVLEEADLLLRKSFTQVARWRWSWWGGGAGDGGRCSLGELLAWRPELPGAWGSERLGPDPQAPRGSKLQQRHGTFAVP